MIVHNNTMFTQHCDLIYMARTPVVSATLQLDSKIAQNDFGASSQKNQAEYMKKVQKKPHPSFSRRRDKQGYPLTGTIRFSILFKRICHLPWQLCWGKIQHRPFSLQFSVRTVDAPPHQSFFHCHRTASVDSKKHPSFTTKKERSSEFCRSTNCILPVHLCMSNLTSFFPVSSSAHPSSRKRNS